MSKALQKQLDLVAKHINKADAMLKAEYGTKAYLFFEAEGSLHAMLYNEYDHECNSTERQEFVICSSPCNFDCGAW